MAEERFYHYHFAGVKHPVTILAQNKAHSRQILATLQLPDEYANKPIEGETTSQPLIGISTMMDGKKKLVWVGKDKTPTGWEEMK